MFRVLAIGAFALLGVAAFAEEKPVDKEIQEQIEQYNKDLKAAADKAIANLQKQLASERAGILAKFEKRAPEALDAVCGSFSTKFIKELAELQPPPVEIVGRLANEIDTEKALLDKVDPEISLTVMDCIKARRKAVVAALEGAVTTILLNADPIEKTVQLGKLTPAQKKTVAAAVRAVQERSDLNKLLREVETSERLSRPSPFRDDFGVGGGRSGRGSPYRDNLGVVPNGRREPYTDITRPPPKVHK